MPPPMYLRAPLKQSKRILEFSLVSGKVARGILALASHSATAEVIGWRARATGMASHAVERGPADYVVDGFELHFVFRVVFVGRIL